MLSSRLPSPPSSSSSAALSLHHCSLCSEVSDSIPTQYDTLYTSNDPISIEKRLHALQDLVSRGTFDPSNIAAAIAPNVEPDESLISLATHIGRTSLPRSPYLGNVSTYDLQETLRAWDEGYSELQSARALKEGKLAPPSSGGCWPARVAASDEGNATVFVGGLAGDVTEWYLAAIFAVFGPYTGVKVLPPKNGTTHCGFVHYVHRSDAEVVVRVMQGFEMMGHRLRISWGRSTSHQSASRDTLGPVSDFRGDRNPAPVPASAPGAPNSIDPSLIVEVAKHIDVKVAQEYLKLVREKFNGDGAAFIETLKTVVAIKGVSPESSPRFAKQLLPPSFSSAFPQSNTAESIWYSGTLPSASSWHRSNDISPLETASEESASRLATPPPVSTPMYHPQRTSQSRKSYDWQGTSWNAAPLSSPVDWAPAPKKRVSTGLGLDFRSYGAFGQ